MAKKNLIRIIVLAALIGVLFFIVRNSPSHPQPSSRKIQVSASFYPLYFFAQQIGGDKAEVMNVTPAGAEPHDYEPTSRDIAQIENSNMLVLNGNGLEAWSNAIVKNIDSGRTLLIVAGEGLANQQVTENGKNILDPHVWLSPALAQQMADRIAQGFIKINPANSGYYETNANALKEKLKNLDAAYARGLSGCAQKNIVTAHAAFGYLAAAYGLHQISITGLSPDSEPSSRQLGEIAQFARSNHITHIFFESLVSPRIAETLAREIGAQTLVLNPIEGLSNEEIKQGKDYFTEMQSNLANLQIALQCAKQT